MAPPTWLPPLNSNHDYCLYVTAQQTHKLTHHDPLAWQYHTQHHHPFWSKAEFSIQINVNVDFLSKNKAVKRSLRGLSLSKTFPIESEFLTSKVGEPTKWSRKVISNMISHMCIPFLLKRIYWEGQQIHQVMSRAVLDDEDDIVECFLQFLCCIRTDPYNEERKLLPVNLNIEKHITLPEIEFERCVSKYDEQKSLDGDFERKYTDAISQSRPEIFALRSSLDYGLLVEAMEETTLDGV